MLATKQFAIIIDAKVALIPLEARSPGQEALLLHAPAVVDNLQMFFEVLWQQATPLVGVATEVGATKLALGPKGYTITTACGAKVDYLDANKQLVARLPAPCQAVRRFAASSVNLRVALASGKSAGILDWDPNIARIAAAHVAPITHQTVTPADDRTAAVAMVSVVVAVETCAPPATGGAAGRPSGV